MTDDDKPKQSVQSAWVLKLRREALRMRDPDVSRIAFVGLLIATYTDPKGGNAWPSPETIADASGYSVDLVRRCYAALVAIGMLERRRRQGKSSLLQLLVPLGEADLDWAPHLVPFETARQAAARRRTRSAERNAEHPSRRGNENTRRDGDQEGTTPVASGDSEHPSRRGEPDREHPSRRPENTRRDGDENTRRVGGVPDQYISTFGRDPDNHPATAWPSPRPPVPAREAGDGAAPSGLQAIEGGGRGGGAGQSPLLLSVQDPAPLDHALIAAHMTALYGAQVPVRRAAWTAVDILGDLNPADPTAHVLAVLDADPDRYRPSLPIAARRAAGDS